MGNTIRGYLFSSLILIAFIIVIVIINALASSYRQF